MLDALAAVILVGEAEWVVAAYIYLGISEKEAAFALSAATDCSPGMVPAGEITVLTRSLTTVRALVSDWAARGWREPSDDPTTARVMWPSGRFANRESCVRHGAVAHD